MTTITRRDVVETAKKYIGYSEKNGKFKIFIDTFNKNNPRIQMRYDWEWCATFVSFIAIIVGFVDLLGGIECGVQRFIDIFKKKGIWEENGKITPKAGDIICYNWDDRTQPNTGWADHIGIVEKVSNGKITVIEGNKGEKVDRRVIPVGWGYIRGYALPKYETESVKPAKPKKGTDVEYRAYVNGQWLDRVTNVDGTGDDSYSGVYGLDINALQVKVGDGDIEYRLHERNGRWLDWQCGSEKNSSGDTYAGDKKKSYDGLQVRCSTGDVEYAVWVKKYGWLDYVTNYGSGDEGYAGIYGQSIQGVRIKPIKKKVK